jgi:hypothetical protein
MWFVEHLNTFHCSFHVLQRSVPEASSLEYIKEQKTGIHSPVDRKGPCLPGFQNSGDATDICLWYNCVCMRIEPFDRFMQNLECTACH